MVLSTPKRINRFMVESNLNNSTARRYLQDLMNYGLVEEKDKEFHLTDDGKIIQLILQRHYKKEKGV